MKHTNATADHPGHHAGVLVHKLGGPEKTANASRRSRASAAVCGPLSSGLNNASQNLRHASITGEFSDARGYSPCPFCVRSACVKTGRSKKGQSWRCMHCKKSHTVRAYYARQYPDYVLRSFTDLLQSNPLDSANELSRKLKTASGTVVPKRTINSWKNDYRKKKLWEYRIPGSRLNTKIRPDGLSYIPKQVMFRHGRCMIRLDYAKDRVKRTSMRLLPEFPEVSTKGLTTDGLVCRRCGRIELRRDGQSNHESCEQCGKDYWQQVTLKVVKPKTRRSND